MNFAVKHYVRIDNVTDQALAEVCRYTFSKKSSLMRRYIREGALRDAERFKEQVERTQELLTVLRTR